LDFYDRMDWPFLQMFAVAVLFLGGSIAVAAFVSWIIFGPQNRTSSLFGTKPLLAVLMAIVPIIVVAVLGYENDFGMNPHLAGAAMAGLLVLYALGEEIGCLVASALHCSGLVDWGRLVGLAFLVLGRRVHHAGTNPTAGNPDCDQLPIHQHHRHVAVMVVRCGIPLGGQYWDACRCV
jgi:hypothetical protein